MMKERTIVLTHLAYYLMRARAPSWPISNFFNVLTFLFSVFVWFFANFSLLCFSQKCKSFFQQFLYISFAHVWKTSLLFSRTNRVEQFRFYYIITEQRKQSDPEFICAIIVNKHLIRPRRKQLPKALFKRGALYNQKINRHSLAPFIISPSWSYIWYNMKK